MKELAKNQWFFDIIVFFKTQLYAKINSLNNLRISE